MLIVCLYDCSTSQKQRGFQTTIYLGTMHYLGNRGIFVVSVIYHKPQLFSSLFDSFPYKLMDDGLSNARKLRSVTI